MAWIWICEGFGGWCTGFLVLCHRFELWFLHFPFSFLSLSLSRFPMCYPLSFVYLFVRSFPVRLFDLFLNGRVSLLRIHDSLPSRGRSFVRPAFILTPDDSHFGYLSWSSPPPSSIPPCRVCSSSSEVLPRPSPSLPYSSILHSSMSHISI